MAWGAGPLVVAADIIFVIFGPGYDTFAKSALDEGRQEAIDRIEHPERYDDSAEENKYPLTSRLAVNKLYDIFESMADDLASGVAGSSFGLVIIGLIALGAAIFWASIMVVARRYLPLKEQDADG